MEKRGSAVGMCKAAHPPCVIMYSSSLRVSVSQQRSTETKGHTQLSVANNHLFPVVTKEYLKSLGNSECSPQTFLENSSSLDKLLIIIRNEDIAAHVHKVTGAFLLHFSDTFGSLEYPEYPV